MRDDHDVNDALTNDVEQDPIEAYCVRCRESIEIDDPVAVWTRRGLPATRGECPQCGGTVFRMGKTDLHRGEERPGAAAETGGGSPGPRQKLTRETVYINFAPEDEAMAEQIAADLEKVGIACWMHEVQAPAVTWAGGAHPALTDCARMIYVLSPFAVGDASVETALRFFRLKTRPVVVAQVATADVPDAVRRSPRFDFGTDYRAAFRQMLQALA